MEVANKYGMIRSGQSNTQAVRAVFVIPNGALIALGAAGVLPPASSAMLHNLSTLGISLRSMGRLPAHAPFPQQSHAHIE